MVDGMPVRGLHQVALRATDLDASIAPYRDLLGLRFIARFDPPGLAFFDLGGSVDAGGSASEAVLYYVVDDLGAVRRSCAAQASRSRTSRRSSTATTTGRSGPPAWRSGWRSCTTRAGTSSGSRSADPAERSSLLEPGDVGSLARVGLGREPGVEHLLGQGGAGETQAHHEDVGVVPPACARRRRRAAQSAARRRAPCWLRSTHRYRSSRRALRCRPRRSRPADPRRGPPRPTAWQPPRRRRRAAPAPRPGGRALEVGAAPRR